MHDPVLFGRYRLLEPAGAGGSAQVWRAIDTETGDEVAVKRLHPVVFADPDAHRRLERESRALQALDHPNIVALRELRIDADEAALVLDYVPGNSLAERLADDTPLAVGEAIGVARDIAAALTAAHASGIIHRDVKPGNIVLAADGRALLTDFGVAVADVGPEATALTVAGTLVGSFRYMAPEQLRGVPASAASDQYALAAVTYEMLAGRPPYAAATPVGLAEEHAAPPAPIAGIRPELESAVLRGLAADPSDRHPDVAAFAAALGTALLAVPGGDVTDVAPVVSPAFVATGPAQPLASVAASPRPRAADASRRDRRALAPLAAVAALLLGGVLVLGAMNGALGTPGITSDPGASPTVAPARTVEPAVTSAPAAQPVDGAEPGKGNDKNDKNDDDKPGKGKGNGGGNRNDDD
jgi:serine/threonine-protein kinase